MFAPHSPPAIVELIGAWLSSSEGFSLTEHGRANLGIGMPASILHSNAILHHTPSPQPDQQSLAMFGTAPQNRDSACSCHNSRGSPKAGMDWGHHTVPSGVCRVLRTRRSHHPSPNGKRHLARRAALMTMMEPPPQIYAAQWAEATETCSEQEIPGAREVPGVRRKAKTGRALGRVGTSTGPGNHSVTHGPPHGANMEESWPQAMPLE